MSLRFSTVFSYTNTINELKSSVLGDKFPISCYLYVIYEENLIRFKYIHDVEENFELYKQLILAQPGLIFAAANVCHNLNDFNELINGFNDNYKLHLKYFINQKELEELNDEFK